MKKREIKEQLEKQHERLLDCFAVGKQNGYTKKKIADKLGVSENQLSYITSSGKSSRSLSDNLARQLADFFGVRADWLLGKDDFKTFGDLNRYVNNVRDDYYKYTPILSLLNELDYSAVGTVPHKDNLYGERQLHLLSPQKKYIVLNQSEWNSFASEVLEFVEFKLQKLFACHADRPAHSQIDFKDYDPDLSITRYDKGFAAELVKYLKDCKEKKETLIDCPNGAAGLAYRFHINDNCDSTLGEYVDDMISFIELNENAERAKKRVE